MRSVAVSLTIVCALAVLSRPVAAQAMVEAASASGAASGAAGGLKALSDTVNAALSGADGSLKAAAATEVVHPSQPAKTAAPPAQPKTHFEDPREIQAGISDQELIRRFGPPSLKISGEGSITLTYVTKSGSIHLESADGKIVRVDKP